MTDYTKTTDFTAKDNLPTGNSAKIVKGSDFDLEFGAVATAISSKADTTAMNAALSLKVDDADIGVTVQAYDAKTAKIDTQQVWEVSQAAATQTESVTGNVTLDFSLYQHFVLTLTGNLTLDNPVTEVVGQAGMLVFVQDGTGSRTVSLGTEYKTVLGNGLTIAPSANAVSVVPYLVKADGEILLGQSQKSFE